ncbi:MAG: hypothetical protein AB7P03_13365 [Kofleriaceae bacterium]
MRWLPLLVLLAGCNDDIDLTGIYRVDVNVSSAPCGADQPVANGPAYLSFYKDEFFGQDYFAYDECNDPEAIDCPIGGGLFSGFYEPIDDGWLGRASSSAGFGGTCGLAYMEQTAVLNGNVLVFELAHYQDEVQLPDDECEPEEAERRGDSMPCLEHQRIEATKL